MKYHIDQSIKIEDTSKDTYICLSNDTTLISSISARDKRLLKLYYRKLEKPIIFKIFTFSVLCAKVLMQNKVHAVTIDREYAQHERQIKSFILQIFRIEGKREPTILFAEIGKKSTAHIYAYKAMQQRRSDITSTLAEVIQYYEKVNKA